MRLNFTRAGSGEALLLVHGLGGSIAMWRPVIGRLAAERDVIAVDLPGFGDSPELPAGVAPSPANLAAALAAFCQELGVEVPHVAGNSLGGWIALEMARTGSAASVCAISPAGLWRAPLGPRRRDTFALGRRLRPLVPALMATGRSRRLVLRNTFGHPDRIPGADAREMVIDYLDSRAYPATNLEMRSNVFDGAGEVDVPVTVAWGELDRLLAPPRPERMPAQARYVVLRDCGHTPTWDDPGGISNLVLEASSAAGEARQAVSA